MRKYSTGLAVCGSHLLPLHISICRIIVFERDVYPVNPARRGRGQGLYLANTLPSPLPAANRIVDVFPDLWLLRYDAGVQTHQQDVLHSVSDCNGCGCRLLFLLHSFIIQT